MTKDTFQNRTIVSAKYLVRAPNGSCQNNIFLHSAKQLTCAPTQWHIAKRIDVRGDDDVISYGIIHDLI